jgi:uncharacterized protein (TIGR00725 family)
MRASFRLDGTTLVDAQGRRFDPATRAWSAPRAAEPGADGPAMSSVEAVTWLQRAGGHAVRVPIGVIGPRDATAAQLAAAAEVGERLADCGLRVLCGGRHGVMQAVCEGVARRDGIAIGLIGDADPALANPFATVVIATGIGEARNALIARASLCLVAIGDSYGTLSEVALGLHFGKRVFGLDGAADVPGVEPVASPAEAVERVAETVLGL